MNALESGFFSQVEVVGVGRRGTSGHRRVGVAYLALRRRGSAESSCLPRLTPSARTGAEQEGPRWPED